MADQQPLRPILRRPGQPPREIPDRPAGNDPNHNNTAAAAAAVPTTKLMLIGCLAGMALLLGCLIVVVQLQIQQAHDRIMAHSQQAPLSSSTTDDTTKIPKTMVASDPTQSHDLYLSHQSQSLPHSGSSRLTAAQVYWNQFRGISPAADDAMKPWNPLDDASFDFSGDPSTFMTTPLVVDSPPTATTTSSSPINHTRSSTSTTTSSSFAETKLWALQRAAQLGHAQAQHVYANALASGVLPLHHDQSSHLQVADDFLHTPTRQQQEAWLNWHMAAMSGHVEAAMALAHRYETLREESRASTSTSTSSSKLKQRGDASSSTTASSTTTTSSNSFQCTDVLPYYQAAAHGIIDKLEASPHSRAKVLPPTEKHLLYHVHLHGGTSSQLDLYNKPDESMEAIQFYHFKATRAVDPDPQAAMTLATFYHYGFRGVTQNLTVALQYYDVAAQAGSWEAAGFAGWFHVFGLGMETGKERNLFQAHKYFRQGIVGGLKGCQERYHKKKRFKQQDAVTQCEPNCLNGMGLLHLLGVPLAVEIDLDEAIEYFTLAKDMGHADAAYNLAMVTLGWKSHYVPSEEALRKQKEEKEKEVLETLKANKKEGITPLTFSSDDPPSYQIRDGPSQLDMQHAVQYLMIAVQKGHLQARHRLAMLYDTGVVSSPDDFGVRSRGSRPTGRPKEVLPQDCEKALKHYKGIVEQASPHVLHRLRRAYKDYIAGQLELSLIQYMSVAELGSEVAQVNAAFLLEQGTCLGLSSTDCHKASVRYWKAAAAAGNAEACLRVGDFYYYGKLRPPQDPLAGIWDRPFGWVNYFIFPEKYWIPAISSLMQYLVQEVAIELLALLDPTGSGMGSNSEDDEITSKDGSTTDATCTANDADGTCSAAPENQSTDSSAATEDKSHHHTTSRKEDDQLDLKMAAHFYRIAAEKHDSPRAHFNLAFLHEWGLGLTQDFPLAKRHYDLAASAVASSREADLAVQIALWTLALHEHVVRLRVAWQDYWASGTTDSSTLTGKGWNKATIIEAVPTVISNIIGKPVPGPTADSTYSREGGKVRKTKLDIVIAHLWTWESLLILILTIFLWVLLQRRRQRTRR